MRLSRLNFAGAVVLVAAASVPTTAQAQEVASVDERAILQELYEAAGGNAWHNNLGWAENSLDVCTWHGVICNEDDLDLESRNKARRELQQDGTGKVLGLNLSSNYLTGRTPSSLWNLPNLLSLDFSSNPHLDVSFAGLSTQEDIKIRSIQLGETSTSSVVGISAASSTLEELELSKSKLNTQIPTDIYSLTQLTTLKMSECSLVGSIPNDIHRLSMLHDLNLYKNSLTGTLPSGMQRLIHLRHLTLSANQLHGSIPSYVNEYMLLTQLWLEDNDFVGSIPSLHQAPELYKVFMNGNSLSGEFPENFMEATIDGPKSHSIYIDLAHNELQGTVPSSLDRLAELDIEWVLGDNKWDDIDESLCDNLNWNKGAVREYDCMGLLCPPGTFALRGYQTPSATCQPCASADYWGATTCYDKDDRSVLVELYVALKGEQWSNSENWLQTDNFCDWYGITCWDEGDHKHGRVRAINLPNNGLEGQVPTPIWSLSHMTILELSYNDIVLTFDGIDQSEHIFSVNVAATHTRDFDGIGNAHSSFSELYVDQVPISGTIPSELFELNHLHVLSMQECELMGEISTEFFDGMTRLRELYLTNNKLSGVLQDRWNELTKLEILALAKNQFRGPVPITLDLVPTLKAITLEDQITKGGGLTGSIPPFSTTKTLRTLRLANNKLDGELPDDLLAGLEGDAPVIIDLAENLLTGKVHGAWDRFARMELFIHGNFITEIEDRLCQQGEWMSGNVKAFGCDAILCPAGTSGGRHVYNDAPCQRCNGGGVSGAEQYLGQTSCGEDDSDKMSERDILELLYDQCGGQGWHSREYWKTDSKICEWYGIDCNQNGSVTSIALGANQLVGSFPTEIYKLPNLRSLNLYSNTLYFDFDGIENARNLQSLGLDGTGLDSLRGIGKARSLVELNVAYNNLSGAIPEELNRLVNLKAFDISHNGMQGFLPYWLRSLVSLTTFSASHNQIAGALYDFSIFRDLIYIDLSHNQMTGSVPPTLFHKSHYDDETLIADLSSNRFTGALPAGLRQMSHLSLQVSNNKITGIEDQLCVAEGWNDNDVGDFGCDAILCPAGTWNHIGRMSNEDTPCLPCRKATYMGTNHCHSGAGPTSSLFWAVVGCIFSSWMLFL